MPRNVASNLGCRKPRKAIPTFTLMILHQLPNELLASTIALMDAKDGLAVAMTCRQLSQRVICLLYTNDARDALNIKKKDGTKDPTVPFALQWACWRGVLATAETSVKALKAASDAANDDHKEVLQIPFPTTGLSEFLGRHGCLIQPDIMVFEAKQCLLHMACLRGNTAIAHLFIKEGVNVTHKDLNGRTAIHLALNKSVAKLLVDNGADIEQEDNQNAKPICSIIYLARFTRSYATVWESSYDAAKDGAIQPGHTRRDFVSTIAYLLYMGAEISPKKIRAHRNHDHYNRTHPLKMAIASGNSKIVQMLLQAGASPNPRVNGGNVKELLLVNTLSFFRPDRNAVKIANMLLDAGAEVEIDQPTLDKLPITAAIPSRAVGKDWLKLYDRICGLMVDVNMTIDHRSLLTHALKGARPDIAKVLLSHGAEWGNRGEFLNSSAISKLLEALQ